MNRNVCSENYWYFQKANQIPFQINLVLQLLKRYLDSTMYKSKLFSIHCLVIHVFNF